jgi:hypothetical protein
MTYTATASEIARLRRMVGEHPATSSEYSNEELGDVIATREGDLHAAAYDVWTWKASAAAALFDWSADGGDYKQGTLCERYKQNAIEEWRQSAMCCGMIIDPTLKKEAA